jgi:excisionase family DNA binding protein
MVAVVNVTPTQRTKTMTTASAPSPAPDTTGMFDVQDLAKLLRCSTRTIYRLSDGGKMPPPLKLGGLCRWPKSKILEWIDRGCQPVRSVAARTGG